MGIHLSGYKNRCTDFGQLLYKYSVNTKNVHYTDIRKHIEDILVAACAEIKCNWKGIKDDTKPKYFWTFILNEDGTINPIPEEQK